MSSFDKILGTNKPKKWYEMNYDGEIGDIKRDFTVGDLIHLRKKGLPSITKKEEIALDEIKERLYNWDNEPGFSDIFSKELSINDGITVQTLKGLEKKGFIYLSKDAYYFKKEGYIVYPTLLIYLWWIEKTGELPSWAEYELENPKDHYLSAEFEASQRKCGACGETGHNARTCKSKAVPFSTGGFWNEKTFDGLEQLGLPFVDGSHVAMISKIVDGEILKEPNARVRIPNITWKKEPITMTWGELDEKCKTQDLVSIGESTYSGSYLRGALAYLPKNTVLTLYTDYHYPLKATFEYGGEEWIFFLAPRVEAMYAENLKDWSEQEMKSHGKDVSFKDFIKKEIKSHGNIDLVDWAKHEEKSHKERYGAEENYVLIGTMQSTPADGYNGYMKMMRDARRLVEIGNMTGLDQKLGEAYQDESGRWFLPIFERKPLDNKTHQKKYMAQDKTGYEIPMGTDGSFYMQIRGDKEALQKAFKDWKPKAYPYDKRITQDSLNNTCETCGEENVHYQFYLPQKNSRYGKMRFVDGATYCKYDEYNCGANICGDCANDNDCENCGAEMCSNCADESEYMDNQKICVPCREADEKNAEWNPDLDNEEFCVDCRTYVSAYDVVNAKGGDVCLPCWSKRGGEIIDDVAYTKEELKYYGGKNYNRAETFGADYSFTGDMKKYSVKDSANSDFLTITYGSSPVVEISKFSFNQYYTPEKVVEILNENQERAVSKVFNFLWNKTNNGHLDDILMNRAETFEAGDVGIDDINCPDCGYPGLSIIGRVQCSNCSGIFYDAETFEAERRIGIPMKPIDEGREERIKSCVENAQENLKGVLTIRDYEGVSQQTRILSSSDFKSLRVALQELNAAMEILNVKTMKDAETFETQYAGVGSLMDIGKGTSIGSFSPEELTESSAIHGDFDSASLNYSGNQNIVSRAEGENMTESEESNFGSVGEGNNFGQMRAEGDGENCPRCNSESLGNRICSQCGHEWEIDVGQFNTESLIEEPDFIPDGDGRALGQQTSSINLSPLHAESKVLSKTNLVIAGVIGLGLWKGKQILDTAKSSLKQSAENKKKGCSTCNSNGTVRKNHTQVKQSEYSVNQINPVEAEGQSDIHGAEGVTNPRHAPSSQPFGYPSKSLKMW